MVFGSFRRKNKGNNASVIIVNPIHKVSSSDSLSSQVSVNVSKPQQEMLDDATSVASNSTRSSVVRRSVTFDEGKNERFYNELSQESYGEITWYGADDYARFKQEMKDAVQKAQEEQEGSQESKKAFYKFVRGLNTSSKEFKGMVRNCEKLLSPRQVAYLKQLYVDSTIDVSAIDRFDLIGLEYQVVNRLQKETKQLRKTIQDAVREVQGECQKGWFKKEELDEECRFACLKRTLGPAMFAQMLAKAQWAAGNP
mmetsp:Transcript_31979/g.66740  ORF Transcript_31979/g.66740 Transcript_31979/m.66740 type:complete len:254 (-) Transcript_31979:95-856(-)|eukprot:CAMPEP_0172456106 /NCGR_PEP_ID=MMETSP1065-20121228/14193_1 /TAXON_ID=265537 /ORGANISM="Amphiprora paludosa, Strain CCMP125" /LENGTH=253 /DNA_ID=CAMNT_0013208783 /DNA_START=101 /DNA_END=862 /DNA_ORIENTATION=+